MCTPATITPVGAAHGGKFIPSEMPETGATMAAAAENTDLINKITFLQNCIFRVCCKYTLTIFKALLNERTVITQCRHFICNEFVSNLTGIGHNFKKKSHIFNAGLF